jgi:tRNA pseudouridine65 synthase
MKIVYEIPVLYKDEFLIVVEKPVGLAVHKNDFMPHDAPYLTKLVGEITGRRIFNVHRLDARTSGVILLAFSSEMAHQLTVQFEHKEVFKKYIAVVQGNPGEGVFNNEVRVKKGSQQRMPAVTHYRTIESVELDIQYKENEKAELSLVDIMPETGRWHQIRQHFAHNRYDIIGDTYHGNFALNRIISTVTGISRLLLHASALRLTHPHTGEFIEFSSPVPVDFRTVMNWHSF